MARRMIYVSDKSGSPIDDTDGAVVKITFKDGRRGVREADVTAQEAEQLVGELNARQVARRGRKPSTSSA